MAVETAREIFEVTKSENDVRNYRLLKLSCNNLRILLISDVTTDKAAASVDVNIGKK